MLPTPVFILFHAGGVELVPDYQARAFANLIKCKSEIKTKFPNTIVGIATIAAVNFAQANEHYKRVGKLWTHKYGEKQTRQHQSDFDEALTRVNHYITIENTKTQTLSDTRVLRPPQLYLHQNVQKFSSKWRDGKKIVIHRFLLSALVDGIHQNEEITRKWLLATHQNIRKLCLMLDNAYNRFALDS
jgi:hypothetical protein